MAIIAKRGFDIRDVKVLLNLHGALRPRGRTVGAAEGVPALRSRSAKAIQRSRSYRGLNAGLENPSACETTCRSNQRSLQFAERVTRSMRSGYYTRGWMWVCTEPSGPGKPCAEMQFSPKVLDLITNWIQKH